MNFGKYVAISLIGIILGQYPREPSEADRAEIREATASLPVDSSIRRTFERGHFGDGLYEPWMDDMKRAGVKSAMIEIRGEWSASTRFRPESVDRIVYRKNYDGPASQIADPIKLAQLKRGGLQDILQRVAFEKSTEATWIGIDSPPKDGEVCVVDVFLYDNQWMADDAFSTNAPRLARYDPTEFPLGYAALAGDAVTVAQQLSKQDFPKDRLSIALFAAIDYPSDNTDVIALLLKAGADVNAVQRGGWTPLMEAAAMLSLSDVRLLLSSGAQSGATGADGRTAYSVAQQHIRAISENKGNPPQYMVDLLNLLRPLDEVQ